MTWMTRRPDPEPPVPDPTIREVHLGMPRLGRGVCWSDIVAEIERDHQRPAIPNPWSPEPPEPSGEAA